jgi:hypothetical protein
MRNVRILVPIALCSLSSFVAATAVASTYPAISASSLSKAIQRDVNQKYPNDKKNGESTTCKFAPQKARVGYSFRCITSNSKRSQLALTKVTLTTPQGKSPAWNYIIVALAASFPKITYELTAKDDAHASVTFNRYEGTATYYDVTLPFATVVTKTRTGVIIADDLSGAKGTSITCRILIAGRSPIQQTSSGPHAVVICKE